MYYKITSEKKIDFDNLDTLAFKTLELLRKFDNDREMFKTLGRMESIVYNRHKSEAHRLAIISTLEKYDKKRVNPGKTE